MSDENGANPKDNPKDDEIEYITEPSPGAEAQETKSPAAKPEEGDETPAEGPLRARLKKRDAEIKLLKKEKEDLRDQMLRKLAETDNLRKRLEREKAEHTQYAMNDILLEFLGILDNFERALAQPPAEGAGDASFRSGVELIYRMCLSLLAKQGVQPLEMKDRAFDPAVHHAMATEESEEVAEPEVGEVLQKGYMIHSRLLRPAMVKVIVPKKKD